MAGDETETTGQSVAGRFSVEEVLGKGGMGAVYRVRDQRNNRQLALKRGYSRDARKLEKRKALLEREYHILAQLAHPSIIEVYDYGVDENGPYYTMELLDGADLDKRGKLPWRQVCALLCDVASSLAILHSRGLLHRDVSSRNVRCTLDGRAKLIDFGTMTSMGVAKEVVGTPPFVAPEALQMQPLDARADLFALGALGYYLLTGRHAFGARRLSDLRDLWRSAPTAPLRIASDVPPALSSLILQLLALDRSARPQSAAEVMERLCVLAGLPMQERLEVSRAYLSTPTLVGRDKALLAVRRRMLSLVRGNGSTLLIEGVSGSGRSRLLDACVLEGKLLGALVLRADASDGAAGEWGVVKTLTAQLIDLLPDQVEDAARLSRPVLARVIDGLRTDRSSYLPMPERSLLLRELRDFVLALTRGQRLLIVIDDADRIDEPSAALLAALAHKTEKNSLLLALSICREGTTSASVHLLRSIAQSIELELLNGDETEALMRSVFGDVDNIQLVAGRVHALSQGSPRATLELAQHLVDRGLARYEAGSWSLPSELPDGELPSTLSASLATRVAALNEDARELGYVLLLADGDPITLGDYAGLTDHRDQRRVFAALDELVAARILVADAERYRFTQRGFLSVLNDALAPERRALLHSRLADMLTARGGDALRRAHHLLGGAREREGIELLCAFDLQTALPPIALAERALAASIALGMPARFIYELRTVVLAKAPMVLAVDAFRAQLGPVLELLERASGLRDYHELAHLPESERLTRALERAQQRHDETPENERVYAPIEAVTELARFCANSCSLALQLYDIEFLEALPSLEPLLPLSPALTVVTQLVLASKETLSGRTFEAKRIYERVLTRLAQPDRAGFDDAYFRGIRLGLHYLLGLVEASMGIASAERHAQVLESDREHRINAWRVRVALFLNQGNAEEARKCQRRAELLQLQEGRDQRYIGTSAAFELIAHALTGDLLGVKRALDAVAELAAHYPGWRTVLALGQCHYRWLQGDLAGALDKLLPVFEQGKLGGRHPYFCYLAAAHVGLLCDLGRTNDAIERGLLYYEECQREGLAAADRWLYLAVAQALAQGGEHDRALRIVSDVISASEGLGMGGLSLGAVYETRARIAIWAGDRPTFERFAERCASEYKKGKNPALTAKFARLLAEAQQNHISTAEAAPEASQLLALTYTETASETLNSQFIECVDQTERARCALTILLQSMDSFAGYLYGVSTDGRVNELASLPEVPADAALHRWIESCLRLELESQVSATATAEGDSDESHSEVSTRFTDAEGRSFEPIFLTTRGDSDDRIAAILVMHVQPGPRTVPPKDLLGQIAAQLIEHGDVSGISI